MINRKQSAISKHIPFVAWGLVLMASSIATAQSGAPDAVFGAPGVQANHGYFAPLDFESIDTLNGNVVLSFTDVASRGHRARSGFQPLLQQQGRLELRPRWRARAHRGRARRAAAAAPATAGVAPVQRPPS